MTASLKSQLEPVENIERIERLSLNLRSKEKSITEKCIICSIQGFFENKMSFKSRRRFFKSRRRSKIKIL